MAIKGYSERGIINSIAYFLDANQEYIYDFIKLFNIPLQKGEYDYTFLVEQSFSDFGDSDLIVIIHDKIKDDKIVIFVECKVKTYLGKFSIDSEFNDIKTALDKNVYRNGISSNLFVQLYYKYLLTETSGYGRTDKQIFMKYNRKTKTRDIRRKIGSNKIVNDTFDTYIKNSKYFFVAITPTALTEMNDDDFQKKIKLLDLMPSNNIHSCSWGEIYKYFVKIKAIKVLDVFDFNNGQIY